MRRFAIGIARAAFNAIYRARSRQARRDEVVFLSRQATEPSYDFSALGRELEARGWAVTMHLKKVKMYNLAAYAVHVWREIGLLARCKVAVIDRYDPVVSLLDFECDEPPAGDFANRDFPSRPVVIQLWHAFGAYKKFGFQNVDGPEGHPSSFMADWRIHRNCSWVICSGEACRRAYAEAFACPVERVVALDRPERDELARLRGSGRRVSGTGGGSGPVRVLMAPTLRICPDSPHPIAGLHELGAGFEGAIRADLAWAFHPLDSGQSAPGNVSDALLDADFVVTDYSSIVYEAYLLGIPTVFYVPDIEGYRRSPGLNVDPALVCPALCATGPDELATLLNGFIDDPATYPQSDFAAFAARAFDEVRMDEAGGTAESRLVDFVVGASR